MVPLLETVGAILYLIATLLLALGVFSKWDMPWSDSRFYLAVAAIPFPVIGPLAACKMVYSHSEKKGAHSVKTDWVGSVLALKIHPAALLVWSIALAIAVALTFQQHDPYFSDRRPIPTTIPR
jgi:hypothetical protein